jgi:hypothetical protein
MNSDIKRIIEIANLFIAHGSVACSTSERIAVAFILNDMSKLPGCYCVVVDAWERLGSWQGYVKVIRDDYQHLLNRRTGCV